MKKIEEKKLTDYQAKILEVVVNNSVEAISYHHPEKNLGKIVEGKSPEETLDALGSLEKDFGVWAFDPKLKFGFRDRGGYEVHFSETKELLDSYIEEKENN